MSVTTFVSNDTLWHTLSTRISTSRHVDAAIAYFGQGGAKLLPLRRGDRLIVDMSTATVRAGGTDPREVERLFERGVQVFTRRNLHAKVVIADRAVISGSANVSTRSQQILDEAAILTNDQAAVRRAREFIDRLCTEPVRPEYIEECKRIYKPPRLYGARANSKEGHRRVSHAKLWVVNLRECEIPDSETQRYERGEAIGRKSIKDKVRSTIGNFHWPSKPRMADELDSGDWILQVTKYKDKGIVVSPPAQLLYIDHYIRDRVSGKERWVFHIEVPRGSEAMTWTEFRRASRTLLDGSKWTNPRTRSVRDVQVADGLLSLWTPAGRISKRGG